MKQLETIAFDSMQFRLELDRLGDLLKSKDELSERDDLQPLFKTSPQLCSFLGLSLLGIADRFAYEFSVLGDFAVDIFIGNQGRQAFCAIELEDARSGSVFQKRSQKSTTEWGRRFERGFSQLVDWFHSFDGHQNTPSIAKHFGYGHVQFAGMLLIGRSQFLSEHERQRLRWRSDQVEVRGCHVFCQTYDQIHGFLDSQWRLLAGAAGQT